MSPSAPPAVHFLHESRGGATRIAGAANAAGAGAPYTDIGGAACAIATGGRAAAGGAAGGRKEGGGLGERGFDIGLLLLSRGSGRMLLCQIIRRVKIFLSGLCHGFSLHLNVTGDRLALVRRVLRLTRDLRYSKRHPQKLFSSSLECRDARREA